MSNHSDYKRIRPYEDKLALCKNCNLLQAKPGMKRCKNCGKPLEDQE